MRDGAAEVPSVFEFRSYPKTVYEAARLKHIAESVYMAVIPA